MFSLTPEFNEQTLIYSEGKQIDGQSFKQANIFMAKNKFTSIKAAASQTTIIDETTDQPRRLNWTAVLIIGFLSLGALGAGLKYLDESAKREKTAHSAENNFNRTEPSMLSRVNPFAAPPTPMPTPQLSKEYIYAGSRMLAVEDANANASPPADLAVWRPSTGYWYVLGGQGSAQTSFAWGGLGDEPVPGDFDGDGKTDFAIWRPSAANSNGTWYVSYSSNGNTYSVTYGLDTDQPTAADFDGDGKTDVAVFRQSTGHWYIQGTTAGLIDIYFGQTDDVPAPADYDGDGKADAAFWRSSASSVYAKRSSDGQNQSQYLGTAALGDELASADYDGDGKADFAIRRGSNWLIRYSASTSYSNANDYTTVAWYAGTDAVENDYDGDGKVDVAVWNASDGKWKIRQSSQLSVNNGLREEIWGGTISGTPDIPVPAFYRR